MPRKLVRSRSVGAVAAFLVVAHVFMSGFCCVAIRAMGDAGSGWVTICTPTGLKVIQTSSDQAPPPSTDDRHVPCIHCTFGAATVAGPAIWQAPPMLPMATAQEAAHTIRRPALLILRWSRAPPNLVS